MKFSKKLTTLLLLFLGLNLSGQSNFNYEISLVPVSVPEFPGIHSYSFAQHEGKWLIIGGRKDGLHARQPFNAFPASENNTEMYVLDIATTQFWSSSVDALPASIREQLQSTNMNFHQEQDTLYIIGGYGFSETSNNHITYPYLTTVNIPGLIDAIQNNQPIQAYFKQIQDDIFAVTGGHLEKLDDLFYLVGGHRFDGRYNPMGNPTYTQEYTNQIRKFTIDNSGDQLSYGDYNAITDPVHLRRRDYNLLPQIFPDGEQGFTISSGVFQINADLPFLYPVDIKANGYSAVTSFNQYLSNYHSAVASLYDSINNQMHAIFFGGMSQYYYENGNLIQDDLVPFVNTISRLTRDADGNLTEYQLPVEMPALKGASAEFISNLNLPHYTNEVLKLSEINEDSIMIGHIVGGINSTALNPFANNQPNLTNADNTIFEVWLSRNPVSINEFEIDGHNPYEVTVFPNPFKNDLFLTFNLESEVSVSYIITNNLGVILTQTDTEIFAAGENTIPLKFRKKHTTEQMFLTVIFEDKYFVSKKLLRD
jgi:hypothetical protein